MVGPCASMRDTAVPMVWLLCTLPLALKVPGPDRVRVLPAWISTIRSPAASVSLSLAFSLAPAGYLLADGPVERTTIDWAAAVPRSEEHTSELQSLMRISYAVFCLKKK